MKRKCGVDQNRDKMANDVNDCDARERIMMKIENHM